MCMQEDEDSLVIILLVCVETNIYISNLNHYHMVLIVFVDSPETREIDEATSVDEPVKHWLVGITS